MATDLHFICKEHEAHVDLGHGIFETGNWLVGNATATGAVGGRVYLHKSQKEAAYHGGTILGWRHVVDEKSQKIKKVFKYQVDGDFAVKCPGRWQRAKAIVRKP